MCCVALCGGGGMAWQWHGVLLVVCAVWCVYSKQASRQTDTQTDRHMVLGCAVCDVLKIIGKSWQNEVVKDVSTFMSCGSCGVCVYVLYVAETDRQSQLPHHTRQHHNTPHHTEPTSPHHTTSTKTHTHTHEHNEKSFACARKISVFVVSSP